MFFSWGRSHDLRRTKAYKNRTGFHRVAGSAKLYFTTAKGAKEAVAADGLELQGRTVGVREVGRRIGSVVQEHAVDSWGGVWNVRTGAASVEAPRGSPRCKTSARDEKEAGRPGQMGNTTKVDLPLYLRCRSGSHTHGDVKLAVLL